MGIARFAGEVAFHRNGNKPVNSGAARRRYPCPFETQMGSLSAAPPKPVASSYENLFLGKTIPGEKRLANDARENRVGSGNFTLKKPYHVGDGFFSVKMSLPVWATVFLL
jgi:hypothetical protein